jgi:LppX_LprAFG lipoprotein
MRKLIAAVAATGLAATLAACSSSNSDDNGRTTSPGSSSQSSSTTTNGPGGNRIDAAHFVALATTAAEKAQTVKIKVSMSLLGAAITASGDLRFGDKTADASVTSSTPIGPVQVIIVSGDVYTKGLAKGDPGRPWTKNASGATEIGAALKKADPRQTLQMLSSIGTLKPVGTETINGVRATHYSVTVDLAKVAKQQPDLAGLINNLIKQGVKVQDVQLWADSQKRPVRLVTSVQLPNPADPTKKITSAQTVDYTDWGAPVTIAAPPADQIAP